MLRVAPATQAHLDLMNNLEARRDVEVRQFPLYPTLLVYSYQFSCVLCWYFSSVSEWADEIGLALGSPQVEEPLSYIILYYLYLLIFFLSFNQHGVLMKKMGNPFQLHSTYFILQKKETCNNLPRYYKFSH